MFSLKEYCIEMSQSTKLFGFIETRNTHSFQTGKGLQAKISRIVHQTTMDRATTSEMGIANKRE